MTPKQAAYVRHRAAGLGQAQAAIKAGYAQSSAKVIASRMEKLPAIRAAIAEARKVNRADAAESGAAEFEDAQSYLAAVVAGTTPADPVRVGAARALLPYQRRRQRAPLAAVSTPREQAKADDRSAAVDLNQRFRARVVELQGRKKNV